MALSKFFTAVKTALEKAFKNPGTTLRHILIFVLVFGLERIFEKDVFNCPDTNYHLYGILFLVGPALSLFVLTLLLNGKFWDVLTGCRLSHVKPSFVVKRVFWMVFQAFLPAGVWIVVALIQTNYYVCTVLGPKDAAIRNATKNITDAKKIKEIKYNVEQSFSKAGTQSHIIAWGFFMSLIILAFAFVCIRRCLFLQVDGILPDLKDYRKMEAEAAVESFQKQIEEIAKEEGKKFVSEMMDNSNSRMPAYSRVEYVREQLSVKYPRTTGDLSKPYRANDYRRERELNGNDTSV